jgi:hypothetical protein
MPFVTVLTGLTVWDAGPQGGPHVPRDVCMDLAHGIVAPVLRIASAVILNKRMWTYGRSRRLGGNPVGRRPQRASINVGQ